MHNMVEIEEEDINLDSDKEAGLISDSPVSGSSSHVGYYFVSLFKLKFLLIVLKKKKKKKKACSAMAC